MSRSITLRTTSLAAVTVTAIALAGCSGGADETATSIKVLMVGNPQMTDLQELTAKNFTAETGIQVDFTVLPENELRDRVAQDLAAGVSQYDVINVNSSETPYYADLGWLADLTSHAEEDEAFDLADMLPSMVTTYSSSDGAISGIPFYGESAFVMYRKDLFEAAGIEMPERPTWDQIAEYAAALDTDDTAGICLRGQPAAGQMFAPLGSMVNTFGGTWFDEDWNAQVDSPEFAEAVQFYVDLVRDHGENGAAQAGFTECLNVFGQGKAAMWFDATAAAGLVENPETSEVAGKVGYAFAPTKLTDNSGWLAGWGWGVPKSSGNLDAAWQFISWASSADYEELVGEEIGWGNVPDGKRASTYENAGYLDHAGEYAPLVLESIRAVDPWNPGTQPRPTIGTLFVAIPEFGLLATRTAEQINAILAGQSDDVGAALELGQQLAEEVAATYRDK